MKIAHVVGTRPNFMNIAPVMRSLEQVPKIEQLLVHTGQHYDAALSDEFFQDLELPNPDVNLRIGSGRPSEQTGRIMMALEPVLEHVGPDWVFTVGGANSTLAASLVAAKLRIPVAHLGAGLRSHERSMPDEINRVVTDRLSSALFTSTEVGSQNLLKEGIDAESIHFVGNLMIDTLDRYRHLAAQLDVDTALGVEPGRFILATLHRPLNVDAPTRLARILGALGQLAAHIPVLFPMHPRTARNVKQFGLESSLAPISVLGPIRYLESVALIERAGVVITDSGGIQDETTVLGVPCIVVRRNTERPISVGDGGARLFDSDPEELPIAALEALDWERNPRRPEFWDGHAAERIAEVTADKLERLSAFTDSGIDPLPAHAYSNDESR